MSDTPRIAFVGIRRSGNHILIEWVAKNYRNVKHFNDCVIKSPGTYVTQGKTHTYTGNGDEDVHFYSFEERTVRDVLSFVADHGNQFDKIFFILRDAYNWGASIMCGRNNRALRDSISLWKQFGTLYEKDSAGFLLYDKFVTDLSYIQLVKADNDLPNSPDELPRQLPTSGIGHGSSFSKGKNFTYSIEDLTHRNRRVKKKFGGKPPQAWSKLLADERVSELNSLIFGRSNANLD
jgi:hypothetical protein